MRTFSITRDRDHLALLLIDRIIREFLHESREAVMINWPGPDGLETVEERELYSAVLGIVPIRIGRANPVRFQPDT